MVKTPKSVGQLEAEKGKLYDKQAERRRNMPTSAERIRPRCPKSLPPQAKKHWRAMAKILENWNIFHDMNSAPLFDYAYESFILEYTREKWWEYETQRTADNYRKNPYLQDWNAAAKRKNEAMKIMGVGEAAMNKIGLDRMKQKQKPKGMEKYFNNEEE